MLRHYVELKAAHPERVLLYRLGDFFECFFEDAIELSRVLELTLTGRGVAIGRVPMAGIPPGCRALLRRTDQAGLQRSLCDQLETTPTKGALLKRDITRVLTPGTVLEEGMLSACRNNWLAAVVVEPAQEKQQLRWACRFDVSTGEVQVMQRENAAPCTSSSRSLRTALGLSPDAERPAWCPERLRLTPMASTPFSPAEAERTLQQHYGLSSLDGLGLPEHPGPAGPRRPAALPAGDPAPGGGQPYSLEADDRAPRRCPGARCPNPPQPRAHRHPTRQPVAGVIALGHRSHPHRHGRPLLRRWLEAPLMDRQAIQQRQDGEQPGGERSLRLAIRQLLRPMYDLERLAGRAGAGHAGARDLVAIADGLERLPQLTARLEAAINKGPDWLKQLLSPDPALAELARTICHKLGRLHRSPRGSDP